MSASAFTSGGDGSSSADDHSSRCSGSTAEHDEQEPFEEFEPKVYQLCHQLGLQNPRVERMKGGSFNRVVAIQCDPQALPPFLSSHYVLRVPRSPLDRTENSLSLESSDLRDQIAILHYVSLRMPSITAPIAAFDLSANNPINSEYALQSRLIGSTLEVVYADMALHQKISMAKQIALILAEMESIKFPTTGLLVAADHLPKRLEVIENSQHYTEFLRVVDQDTKPFGRKSFNPGEISSSATPPRTLESFLHRQFTRRIADENQDVISYDGVNMCSWESLFAISQEMKDMGWLEDSQGGILHHLDLEPRNIIVNCKDSSDNVEVPGWNIVGVIDWDDAVSHSPIVAHYPPAWLWDSSEEFSLYRQWPGRDEDKSGRTYEQWDENWDSVPPQALSEEQMAVKEAFDVEISKHIPAYCHHAYGEGRLVRKLAGFARQDVWGCWNIATYPAFLREWDSAKEIWKEHHKGNDHIRCLGAPSNRGSSVEGIPPTSVSEPYRDPTMPQNKPLA